MLGIKEMRVNSDQAYAVVTDGIKDYKVKIGVQDEHFYSVYDAEGSMREAYMSLQDTIYSCFSDIFR